MSVVLFTTMHYHDRFTFSVVYIISCSVMRHTTHNANKPHKIVFTCHVMGSNRKHQIFGLDQILQQDFIIFYNKIKNGHAFVTRPNYKDARKEFNTFTRVISYKIKHCQNNDFSMGKYTQNVTYSTSLNVQRIFSSVLRSFLYFFFVIVVSQSRNKG